MFILYDKPVEDKSIYDNKALHNLLSMRLFREASYRFIQPFTEIAYEAKICNVFNGIYVEKRDFMLNFCFYWLTKEKQYIKLLYVIID